MPVASRMDAGRKLGEVLGPLRDWSCWTVVGLIPGGLAVAHGVAERLRLPSRALVVKTVTTPTATVILTPLGPGLWTCLDSDAEGTVATNPRAAFPSLETAITQLYIDQARYGRELLLELVPHQVILCNDRFERQRIQAALHAFRLRGTAEIVVAVPSVPTAVGSSFFGAEVTALDRVSEEVSADNPTTVFPLLTTDHANRLSEQREIRRPRHRS